MNNITQDDLIEILNTLKLDNIILFDLKGNLIETNTFKYDKNFAAMSGIITTMCKELILELQYGHLNKIMIQAEQGLILINKVTENQYIGSFTNDISKIGILMKTLETLINNKTPNIN